MSKEKLLAEMARFEDYEHFSDRLIDVLEDGIEDVGISTDMATISLAVLRILSDAFSRRITEVDNLLEAEANQTMDRFRRRQI